MSSILNALKKLEKDPPPKDETQIFQQQIDTKRAINKRAKGTWLFRKFATLFIVAVIVVSGGWFAWNQKSALRQKFFPDTDSSEKKAETTPPSVAQKKRPSPAPARMPQKTDPAPNLSQGKKAVPPSPEKVLKAQNVRPHKAVAVPEHKKESEEKPAAVSAPPEKVETNVAKPAKLSGREMKALNKLKQKIAALEKRKSTDKSLIKEQAEALDIIKKKISELEEKQATAQPITRRQMPAERPKKETRPADSSDKSSPIREASSANLKIQALVWSDEPADRWVMINNRIIKTGGSVDDIVVSEIGNDHIIIQENGEEKKVKFQLK